VRQRWASKALSDLDAIRDHSINQWGRAQTSRYLQTIRDAVAAASQAPMQAAPADHYRPGYRKITVGAHLVFFRINADAIEIARILHAAMEIDTKLE
jgi:toxin ParE1/3/4